MEWINTENKFKSSNIGKNSSRFFCCDTDGKGFDVRKWIIGFEDYYVITIHLWKRIFIAPKSLCIHPSITMWFYYSCKSGKRAILKPRPLPFFGKTFFLVYKFLVDEFAQWKRNFNYFRLKRFAKSFFLKVEEKKNPTNRASSSNVAIKGKRATSCGERVSERLSYLVYHLFSFH